MTIADAVPTTPDEVDNLETDCRKPYIKPEITCELELETRAGSPIGLMNVLNPFEPRKL